MATQAKIDKWIRRANKVMTELTPLYHSDDGNKQKYARLAWDSFEMDIPEDIREQVLDRLNE